MQIAVIPRDVMRERLKPLIEQLDLNAAQIEALVDLAIKVRTIAMMRRFEALGQDPEKLL